MTTPTPTTLERLMTHVVEDLTPHAPNPDPCWIWTGATRAMKPKKTKPNAPQVRLPIFSFYPEEIGVAGGGSRSVRPWLYTHLLGPLARPGEGLYIIAIPACHPMCVRPSHMTIKRPGVA
jgi:hypothetical protein